MRAFEESSDTLYAQVELKIKENAQKNKKLISLHPDNDDDF